MPDLWRNGRSATRLREARSAGNAFGHLSDRVRRGQHLQKGVSQVDRRFLVVGDDGRVARDRAAPLPGRGHAALPVIRGVCITATTRPLGWLRLGRRQPVRGLQPGRQLRHLGLTGGEQNDQRYRSNPAASPECRKPQMFPPMGPKPGWTPPSLAGGPREVNEGRAGWRKGCKGGQETQCLQRYLSSVYAITPSAALTKSGGIPLAMVEPLPIAIGYLRRMHDRAQSHYRR